MEFVHNQRIMARSISLSLIPLVLLLTWILVPYAGAERPKPPPGYCEYSYGYDPSADDPDARAVYWVAPCNSYGTPTACPETIPPGSKCYEGPKDAQTGEASYYLDEESQPSGQNEDLGGERG